MANFKPEREDYVDSMISPMGFPPPLMSPMMDLSPYGEAPGYMPPAMAMPTASPWPASALGAGYGGMMSAMDPQGQPKVWTHGEFGLPYGELTPMALEQHHPGTDGTMAAAVTQAAFPGRTPSTTMPPGSQFASYTGHARSSASMSRTSSFATSLSGRGETTVPSASAKMDGAEPPEDVHVMGYQDANGEWRCRHEGCTSKKSFTRACDLRKHFRLHEKSFFCSHPDCPWSRIGFSLRKDCRRHEASHKPEIECPAEGCDRTFSRSDNMKEHYKKIHQRATADSPLRAGRKRTTK